MIPYASAMGSGRNREALRAAGWGFLVSPLDPRPVEGFRHCLDNGEWPAFRAWVEPRVDALVAKGWKKDDAERQVVGEWIAGGWREQEWDEEAFEQALERYGPTADFVVLPDIVAVGAESLALSLRWSNRCMSYCSLVLIAVQDGMEPEDVEPYVGPRVGIFLGGSTEWKIANMEKWGRFCAERDIWYHVARVNTRQRFRLAAAAGASSTDGSSASKFADTLPKMDVWRRQLDLYAPR